MEERIEQLEQVNDENANENIQLQQYFQDLVQEQKN